MPVLLQNDNFGSQMSAQEESRPGGRRPANQYRNAARTRDATTGSQPTRPGGRSNLNVSVTEDEIPPASNGPALPAPDAPALPSSPTPAQDEQTSISRPSVPTNAIPAVSTPPVTIPTFNLDEVKKVLAAGVEPDAEVYKAPKSPAPTGAKALNPGQMANGQDFWLELRKQVTELLREREKEEQAAKQHNEQEPGAEGAAKGG